jgi:hypothetical protein
MQLMPVLLDTAHTVLCALPPICCDHRNWAEDTVVVAATNDAARAHSAA